MDLSFHKSLETLQAVQQTAAEFAKREEQLYRNFRSRRYNVEKKFQGGVDETNAKLVGQIEEIEAEYARRIGKEKAAYQGRKERIDKVIARGVRGSAVRKVREKWLGMLQREQFELKRQRHQATQVEEQKFAAVGGVAEEQSALLKKMMAQAKVAFSAYLTFSNAIKKPVRGLAQGDPATLAAEIPGHVGAAWDHLESFRKLALPKIFSGGIFYFIVGVLVVAALGLYFGVSANAALVPLVLLVVTLLLHHIGWQQGRTAAFGFAKESRAAQSKAAAALAAATPLREEALARIAEEYESKKAAITAKWDKADDVEAQYIRAMEEKLATQGPRALRRNEEHYQARKNRLLAEEAEKIGKIQAVLESQQGTFNSSFQGELHALALEEEAAWDRMADDWNARMEPLLDKLTAINRAANEAFPDWTPQSVKNWQAAKEFITAAKFGHLEIDFSKQKEALPTDSRLKPVLPLQISVPLALSFPQHGSLLLETSCSGDAALSATLNNIILRILSVSRPGKAAFTIIDPVGLGQNFAGLMHLADFEETLINRRIWTQRDQIEERLGELNDHIEKVIQMYLRNEYETISEYNAQAGTVAEKYHFLVVSDFPVNFSETAVKRLQSIAVSGPRCGVFTLIHWDNRQPNPDGFVPEELRRASICLKQKDGSFVLATGPNLKHAQLVLDPPPSAELAVDLVQQIGKASVDSNRVEVPFEQVIPKAGEFWQNDTTHELRVPIGRTGATKLQYLAIGKGTRQHALFAGKTGSGKSTLFHVIITNLALHSSPEQVEFYLIDFKKGVEFKCYATHRLPHAKVIAIESDREFGLSVLQRVDDELKRRGDLFRKMGVQDLAGYVRAGGKDPIPRTLLIIDEFQEIFVEDDAIAQNASLLFDRIVRQGRAFGIHVLLGSQTLGGAYTLARTTLGQMAIRVALQCNEADAYLIMDDGNSAPRLLSRPGEGIYNDASGAVEGNSPFQVVWLSDEERDSYLEKVERLAENSGREYAAPIVFEGNAPAEVRENAVLAKALAARPAAAPLSARMWLGAPNSIKGPTEAHFQRQSGNHLLIVGQREEAALSMLCVGLVSLAAQFPVGGVKLVLLHGSAPGSSEEAYLERLAQAIPHDLTVSRGHDLADLMKDLASDVQSRSANNEQGTATFLFIHGLHKFKKLRKEDDFNFGDSDSGSSPADALNQIINEGSSYGVHLIATADTLNNVNRFMSRKALSEIEMRVLFQMSANDSAALIDSTKASNLGLHRALFYNEQEGHLETFRPYALPELDWIEETAAKLKR